MDALVALFGPAIEWHSPGPDIVPWAGHFRGPADAKRFFSGLATTVDFESFVPSTFVCEGDRVVVLGSARAKVKRNGAIIENPWAHEFVVKDGKIVSFRAYDDTHAIVEALTR